ncbi:MAG: helix-turn-helix domain-containing protein [Thermoanaerobaculaceae bacterium]
MRHWARIASRSSFPPPAASACSLQPYTEALRLFRRDYFLRLLETCGGNRSEAARRAGISRQTLLYHLRELAIR